MAWAKIQVARGDTMANEQQGQSQDNNQENTGDARAEDKQRQEGVDIGYGKDTGEQGKAATAGGREGTFSLEDERETDSLKTEWSPGSDQPKT
jgi:hypothetical protein